MARRRYVVSGMVQGVGFRWFALREAHRLALHGWVRNLPDGSVEALAEGAETQLAEFEAALTRGPRVAQVQAVARSEAPPEGELPNFFEIR
jgi:acylphosphatase